MAMEASRDVYDHTAQIDSVEVFARKGRPMPHDSEERDGSVDLWKLCLMIWDLRLLILTISLLAMAVGLLIAWTTPKRYVAMATVFVTPSTFASELKPPPLSVEAYERLAKSDYMQNRVIDTLRKQELFGPDESAGRFETTLYPSREPQKPYLPLIGLAVRAENPIQAQRIANTWASLFVHEQGRLATLGKAHAEFILIEYPKASAQLAEEERHVVVVEQRHGKAMAALKTNLALELKRSELFAREEKIVQLEDDLARLRLQIEKSRQTLTQLDRELKTTAPHLMVSKAITDDALWQNVVRQGQAGTPNILEVLASAKLQTQEINPVHVSLSHRLADERIQLNSLVPMEGVISQQLAKTRADAAGLRAQVREGERTTADLESHQRAELAAQERSLTQAQERFDKLAEKVGAAQVAKADQDSDVRVSAYAELPQAPVNPGFRKSVAYGGAAGLGLSLVLALFVGFVREQRDRTRVAALERT